MNFTTLLVPMSHYCVASSAFDRINRWDADARTYENGYAEETTQCPACGSWVSFGSKEEHDDDA
jgi:hypothetical protein